MILVSNSKVPLLWNWRNNTIQPPSEHSQPCSPLESWQASAYCSMCHRSLKGSLKFIEGEKKVTGTRYYTTSWENLWLRRCWPSFETAKGLLFERVNRQLLSCNHWFKLNWHKDIMKTWVKYNKREKKIFFPRYIYPCFKVVCYSHDIIDRWTSHFHIFSVYFLSDQVKA